MSDSVRIALAQIDVLVGDLSGNAEKIIDYATRARDEFNAHAVIFPELAITGYPPEDLLLRPGFIRRSVRALERVSEGIQGIDVVVGHPWPVDDALYNAVSVLRDGDRVATYHKHRLPNYGVFDEQRYFVAGSSPEVVDIAGIPTGLSICEDIWTAPATRLAASAGARLIININASPFHTDRIREREQLLQLRVSENSIPIIYTNLVGGQDELVFDGGSFVVDDAGEVMHRAPSFSENLSMIELQYRNDRVTVMPGAVVEVEKPEVQIYEAIRMGVRDYVNKNRFAGVVIGLSGGIDSALTLALAVDALGADRVTAVMMPSRFTSNMSLDDARSQAEKLGVNYKSVSIEPMFEAFLAQLQPVFGHDGVDVTEENIQARIRGVILMAISNKLGKMVLTTGNKSEMAVGYATLYGDMAGGFAAIKDVPKTWVYRLAAYRNSIDQVIPQRVIDRPPSAELAPDQQDSDSLPPYDLLDAILERYVEQDLCIDDIVEQGFDAETVARVAGMVDRNEYKRRQAPPGVRISRKAFGRDRRYPITSGYFASQTRSKSTS